MAGISLRLTHFVAMISRILFLTIVICNSDNVNILAKLKLYGMEFLSYCRYGTPGKY
jgi:hypothetical protein